MKKQDILSILITFSVGFIGGGFLYVVHFSKLVAPLANPVPTQESQEAFTVVSEAYGGCRSVCPAFRLTADGKYRLLYYENVDGERLSKEGTLPRELMKGVKQALRDERALVEQSQEIEPRDCNSYADGIDVRYTVTLEGAEYDLDSCGTAVDGNGPIWSSLAKIWDYFRTVE